jgi:hypothetical protein
MSFKLFSVLIFVIVSSLAGARDSFLFGESATDAFGPFRASTSERYFEETNALMYGGFSPLIGDFGADRPTALRILIKDDKIQSELTQKYIDALSAEKPNLMAIYRLSDRDYNRLAAIAFGVLGRETKFGRSLKYFFKETHQREIFEAKLAKKKFADYEAALRAHDPAKFFAPKTWTVARNSRGLTQIKTLPAAIIRFYCFNENELNDPRVTAIATLGFLAESLKILKNRVRNQHLTYVTQENLFDYVLYVYFGSIKKLVNLVVDPDTGRVVNDAATPEQNVYVQTVRRSMRSLALFESPTAPFVSRPLSACRVPVD